MPLWSLGGSCSPAAGVWLVVLKAPPMPIPLPTPHRLALLGLLLASLVLLADGAARVELARAVNASLGDGARVIAHIAVADD